MPSTKRFFSNKKEWSKIKDNLLENYLKLYFQKIFTTDRQVNYIDCFAGKGKFDDGKIGSPLIAIKIAEEAIKKSRNKFVKISYIFIEKEYAKFLSSNLISLNNLDITVYDGSYLEKIDDIIKNCLGQNVFLYVDPCGIKYLDFEKFSIIKNLTFNSVEMLLNLNTFGFLREACRLLSQKDIFYDFGELEEREIEEKTKLKNDIPNMNKIANGDYWQKIILDSKINAITAEELFVEKYCEKLKEIFKYVISIPIKVKVKNMPKYRMIFCTNNTHGYIEMATNMYKRWKEMQENERNGQLDFFGYEVDFKGEIIESDIRKAIFNLLSKQFTKYDIFLCKFIDKNGIMNLTKVNSIIKEMEKNGELEVKRNPPLTDKEKPAKWIDYKRNMEVRLI